MKSDLNANSESILRNYVILEVGDYPMRKFLPISRFLGILFFV